MNKHQRTIYAQRSRARRYGVVCNLTLGEWIKILEESKGVCAYCKQYAGIELLTLEHIKPLSKGGENSRNNVIAVCGYCNAQKRNQEGDVTLRTYPFIEKENCHIGIWDVAKLLGYNFDTQVQELIRKGRVKPVGIWNKNCKTPLFLRKEFEK